VNKSGRAVLECGTGNPVASTLNGADNRSLIETMNSENPSGETPPGAKKVAVQVLDQPPTELPADGAKPAFPE